MDWNYLHDESLVEIVFRNRNREYGSYWMHCKYPRTLLISISVAILIFLLIVLIPFILYYIEDSTFENQLGYIYEVEYLPMSQPDEELIPELAQAYRPPPEENVLPPVVTDSVQPEEEKPPLEKPPENQDQVEQTPDSLTNSTGSSGAGSGLGRDSTIAMVIDVYPKYPGGDNARLLYLRRNVRYPEEAVRNKIQGVVMVVFIIELDGSISGVKISKGIGEGCDEEAVRVTKGMPRWEPGKRHGRPVRVLVRMPIVFKLPPG